MIDDILTSFNGWFSTETHPDNLGFIEDIDRSDESSSFYPNSPEAHHAHSHLEQPISEEISEFDLWELLPNWDASEDGVDIDTFAAVAGNPVENSEFWHQQAANNSCAVVAQLSIYESITGVCIPEDKACEIAQQSGCFDPETGTKPSDVGKVLNELGIPTEQKYDASLEDIADALERGERVIVGLDANEIWHPIHDANGNPVEQANAGHAVWVTGIDTQPDGTVKIILNDSGTPNGKMSVVDAADFLNAWQDCGNFTTVTRIADRTISV